MERCTGRRDIRAILLKTARNTIQSVNPPNNKLLAMSKSKAFTDEICNDTQSMKFVCYKAENIVGKKGENAGFQHFLLFPPQCFQTAFSLRGIKKSSLSRKRLPRQSKGRRRFLWVTAKRRSNAKETIFSPGLKTFSPHKLSSYIQWPCRLLLLMFEILTIK